MRETHEVLIETPHETYTLGRYDGEAAAVAAAKEWLGPNYDRAGHRLSWVSQYGENVVVERID